MHPEKKSTTQQTDTHSSNGVFQISEDQSLALSTKIVHSKQMWCRYRRSRLRQFARQQ